MRILNVAEKPDAAKKISSILSSGQASRRDSFAKYNPVWEFNYRLGNQNVQMVFTSVLGHLKEMDFEEKYQNWNFTDPIVLFDAEIKKFVSEQHQPIEKNLQQQARNCDQLILWLDCDREGENIAFEVLEVCKAANQRIQIHRARFSDMTNRSIQYSIEHLVKPNEKDNDAVEARREIDLRIGSVFTRFQTMRIKSKFDGFKDVKVISYGPCQFPCLGFIVDRFLKKQGFISENFWSIKMSVTREDMEANFVWKRGRIFEKMTCIVLYELCIQNPMATVTQVTKREKRKWSPFPLNTVEFQKLASSKLHIDSSVSMHIAEHLYNRGLISYPRTETDSFSLSDQELTSLLSEHVNDGVWGNYVTQLVQNKFKSPKKGKHDDKAHPPIHPTKYINDLTGDEKRIYELICRHFFACCSEDAIGHETVITAEIGYETFTCSGTMISAKNYLDIYPYDKWYSKTIPVFEQGSTFQPTSLLMKQDETRPPSLLTEEALIGLMDTNSIGTDATIAQHIKTVLDRKYAVKMDNVFEPTKLGIALIEAYNDIGFKLSQPHLRAKMENEMKKISLGTKTKEMVLVETLQLYKSVYIDVIKNVAKMDQALKKYFKDVNWSESTVLDNGISKCKCGTMMSMIKKDENRFCYCSKCKSSLLLPRNGEIKAVEHICPLCQYQALSVNNGQYHLCPWCMSNPPDIENVVQSFKCFNCNERSCPISQRQENFGECPDCGNVLMLKKNKSSSWSISCKGYPNCNHTIWLPKASLDVSCGSRCSSCPRQKLKFKFENSSMPPHIGEDIELCIYCSTILNEFINFPRPNPNSNKKRETPRVEVDAKRIRQEINTAPVQSSGKTISNGQIPLCEHQQPCVVRRSKKENENKGREFYCCGQQQNGCKFFQWKE